MAPLLAEVQAVLNERSADRVAQQLKDQMGDAGKGAGNEFSTGFHTGLRGGIDEAVKGFTSQFGAMGDTASSVLTKIPVGAAAAATGIAAIAIAAVKVGEALYGVGEQFDDAFDTLAVRTNLAGEELDGLNQSLRNVAAQSASSLGDVADILGRVNQSLHLDGAPLEVLTDQIADLNRNTGETLNIRDLGRVVSGFGQDAKNAAEDVDALYTASAATGVPINELLSNMVTLGPAARTLGLNFGETTNLLTLFERGGIDASKSSAALTHAAGEFADANIPLKTGLADTITQIKGFTAAGDEAAATNLAKDVFGQRGAQQFVDLIRNGKLTVQDLNGELENSHGAVGRMDDKTRDWSENFEIIKNRVSDIAETFGGPLYDAINGVLGQFADMLTDLDATDRRVRELSGITNPPVQHPDPNGSWADVMLGPQPTAPGSGSSTLPWPLSGLDHTPPPPDSRTPQDIAGALADAAKKSGAKESLPEAPVVPRAGVPGLMPGLMLTSGLLGAQQGVAEAETRLAEAKARVLQLDGTNLATEQDRLKARNDLAKAEQDKLQADLRFNEAQQSALKAQNKAVDDLGKGLGKLGAQLDSDFGASGGLPGILENATKALANLGFAPVVGALRGVQAGFGYDQSDLGGGILGALGATGVFGQQFVKSQDPYSPLSSGAGTAATSLNSLAAAANTATGALGGSPSLGSSALGGISDTELLSRVPAGSYQTPDEAAGSASWDLTKGLGDCSSAVEDLVNLMDGRPTAGRSLSTGNAAEWLPQHGFLPGLGGPGDFRVGYNDHHMQATTAGGVPFNWGSDAAAARGGIGGTGADDPSFTDHWYRPMTTPMSSIPGLDGPLLSPSSAPSSPSAPGAASVPSTSGSDPLGLGLPTYGGLTSQQLTDPGLTPMPGGGSGGPRTSGLPRGLAPGFGIPGAPSILGMDPGGADPSQSVAGGRAFGQGVPASGGIGIGGGGLLGMLGSAAQGAIGLAASGAAGGMDGGMGGAAASAMAGIGIQEIQRAISAGGQYVGALAGGLLETFSLNDSALADPGKSWLGRIGVAVAGARPALPNSAGEMGGKENKNMAEGGKKPPGPMSPQQAKGGKGGQPGADGANGSNVGKGDGTTYNLSVTNNNNNTRFDPTHNDMQNLMSASAASRQPR